MPCPAHEGTCPFLVLDVDVSIELSSKGEEWALEFQQAAERMQRIHNSFARHIEAEGDNLLGDGVGEIVEDRRWTMTVEQKSVIDKVKTFFENIRKFRR